MECIESIYKVDIESIEFSSLIALPFVATSGEVFAVGFRCSFGLELPDSCFQFLLPCPTTVNQQNLGEMLAILLFHVRLNVSMVMT